MCLKIKRLYIVSMGLLFTVITLSALTLLGLDWGRTSKYIDTANYSKLMERYDGFEGVPLEEAIQLLTKNGIYVIVRCDTLDICEPFDHYSQLNDEDKIGMSVLYFPVQNSRSREECFIKGLLLDKASVVVAQTDIQISTDDFFKLYENSKGQ